MILLRLLRVLARLIIRSWFYTDLNRDCVLGFVVVKDERRGEMRSR